MNIPSVSHVSPALDREIEDVAATSTIWWFLLIFVAALLPRLFALSTFLTIDEVKWAEGAAQFLIGLYAGDLFQTYWHFHPGITITWGEVLILWAGCATAPNVVSCANSQVENLPESIGWLRLSPVLLTSFGVAGVYVLVRKLFDHKLALLTTLLLAFDPFFIAHSRIINGDAGAAILMFLSLLAFLIYAQRILSHQARLTDHATGTQASRRHRHASVTGHALLVLSGVFAGLAVLTKLPAPLIAPLIAGLSLIAIGLEQPGDRQAALRRWLIALLIWSVSALLTFVALWPALWVAPLQTLRRMYIDTFEVGGADLGHDTFFLGQTVSDPGLWFYPYAVAFRLTPVVMAGGLLAIGWLVWRFKAYISAVKRRPSALFSSYFPLTTMLVMIGYVIFIILFSSISPKKLDRYVMAVIPALIFLAALGFDRLWTERHLLWASTSPGSASRLGTFLFVAAVGLQLAFALFSAPYYLGYYNPLLGGVKRAVTQVPVGWGEGLEEAAFYLNSLPNAESLTVSSWYGDIFQPYFVGQRASFSDDGRAQLAADYVVFYVNQAQRQKPYAGLVDYFRAGEPVFTVAAKPTGQIVASPGPKTIGEIHWVEVYKAPAAQSAGGAPKIEGVAQLLAYKVTNDQATRHLSRLAVGDKLAVALYLKVLGPLPEETTLAVALTPAGSEVRNSQWGDWILTDVSGEWGEGNVVEWQGQLTLPLDMPPGDYRLWVAFQFQDGQLIVEAPISEDDPIFYVE